MGNILSYLKWRGDLTFAQSPFNEVDNLILSQLAYTDFCGCVPGIGENSWVFLKDAVREYRPTLAFLQSNAEEFLMELAKAPRFADSKLSCYVDVTDHDQEMTQFAALHIELSDGTVYVAFRGTDTTIVGWREDFCLGFQIVPAQRRAVEYLNRTLNGDGVRYRIGGHSKGGNLAVYAVMMCQENIRGKIIEIYSNDGPGLCDSIIDQEQYAKIQKKIRKIVPEFSIIGQLFACESECAIVKSAASGILQHDPMSWEVEGYEFQKTGHLNDECRLYNQIFDMWIEDVDMEHRQVFIEDFFGALTAGGAKNIKDVVDGGVNSFETILLAMGNSDRKTKLVVGKFFKSLFQGIKKLNFSELIKTKKTLKGACAFLLGIFLMAFSEISQQIIGTAFFLWLLCYSVLRLVRFYQKYKRNEIIEKPKIIFYGFIAAIELLCIIKNTIIIISTNFVLGFFFSWRGWKQAKNAVRLIAKKDLKGVFPLLDAVLAACLGVVALAAVNDVQPEHIMVTGTYLTIYGMVEIGKAMYHQAKDELQKTS